MSTLVSMSDPNGNIVKVQSNVEFDSIVPSTFEVFLRTLLEGSYIKVTFIFIKNIFIYKFLFTLYSIILISSDSKKNIIHSELFFSNTKFFLDKTAMNSNGEDTDRFKNYINTLIAISRFIEFINGNAEQIKIMNELSNDPLKIFNNIINSFDNKRSSINDFLINMIILFDLKIKLDNDKHDISKINNKLLYDEICKSNKFIDKYSSIRSREVKDVNILKEAVWKEIEINKIAKNHLILIYLSIEYFKPIINSKSFKDVYEIVEEYEEI